MTEANACQRRDLGLLRVTGNDARGFLHAQTTQEFKNLPPSETRLAAWLSAKGRVRAIFDVLPSADGFWLTLEADNVDWVAEQLGRYVLRSDVRLDVVTDWAVVAAADEIGPRLTDLGIDLETGRVTDAANLAAIAIGRPIMPASLRERYTPHMLNLERLGAVSFNKGCYPGQEIVARTENLGSVKRRIKRFGLASGDCPTAGNAIIDADDQSVGDVNRVAAMESGYELLAVVPVDSDPDGLRLESDGRGLRALPLP